ncbi:MAG TPA: ABC transporter ATP-binding protein [Candidatus Binatus sp.]|nr:ABC transporter ATP-binding protein [Candidatus Binatus sp.]
MSGNGSPAPLLSVHGLRAGYGRAEAVHGIDLQLSDGRVATIIGANGAGKTTTLLALSGVITRSAGTVEFLGERIDGRPPHAIVAAGLIQVPEGRLIIAHMTVRENLEIGAWSRPDRGGVRDDLEAMFSRFPILRERANVLAGSLSGGEQQMLAIARGLMARPRLLLLDEPSMGLSPVLVAQVYTIVKQLRDEGLAILLVEQNARQALAISDHAYVMERGTIVKEGAARDLATDPTIVAAYLGDSV